MTIIIYRNENGCGNIYNNDSSRGVTTYNVKNAVLYFYLKFIFSALAFIFIILALSIESVVGGLQLGLYLILPLLLFLTGLQIL